MVAVLSMMIIVLIVSGMVFLHKRFLRVIVCDNNEGAHELSGQFKAGVSSALLPNPKGVHTYRIMISNGKARLNLCSYNPDGATWSLPPNNNRQAHFDLDKGGTYTYEITIGDSFGENDRLELVNTNPRQTIRFSYVLD